MNSHEPSIVFSSSSLQDLLLPHFVQVPRGLNLLILGDLRELAHFPQTIINDSTLLLALGENFVAIGPHFLRGHSVCLGCTCHWVATAGFDKDKCLVPRESDARFAVTLLAAAASEYDKTGEIAALRTAIQTFDVGSGKSSVHPINPLHDCKLCSGVDRSGWHGLRIHCSPLTGIIQKMEITQEPIAGAFRAMATWAAPLPFEGRRPLLARQESHGRGTTRQQAELGCIGEALERYSLIYRGDEPLIRARMNEINGIDPREILLYSHRQYKSREEWNRKTNERYFVGEIFDPDQPIDWFPATNLLNGHEAFVPAACTLMWYQFPIGESEFARSDTIGCGSGWTFLDALLHALLEWIERDAMAIWWYNGSHRPSVDIDSFDLPQLREVRNGIRQIDRDLVLLDCTTDLGVPTYISVAARNDGSEPLFAGAANLSPQVAAWRAASEVGQLWFTIAHKKSIDPEMRDWLANTLDTQPFLKPTHVIQAAPEPPSMTSAQQLACIVDRLRDAGLSVYACDLSRSDVLLKTARAVVPGLRHIWNRRAPGRLYEVPVRLRWRNSPLGEDELNSICCMI